MTTDTPNIARAGLYRKIAAVAGELTSVGKDGYNPQLKYKYATPASVIEAVKPVLAAHQLAIVPTVAGVIKEDTGGKTTSGAAKVLTRVEMIYLILDGETGESLAAPWCGEGEDWSDKGIAKAQTIALRTFLLNLFQIPSVDEDTDPDARQAAPQQQRNGAHYDERRPVAGAAPRVRPNGPMSAQQQADDGLFPPKTEVPIAPMSPAARATVVTRIRKDMERAQAFGFDDQVRLGVNLEGLNDAQLLRAAQTWKERADELAAKDAAAIPA